mgnify:CR=1 FL=1
MAKKGKGKPPKRPATGSIRPVGNELEDIRHGYRIMQFWAETNDERLAALYGRPRNGMSCDALDQVMRLSNMLQQLLSRELEKYEDD